MITAYKPFAMRRVGLSLAEQVYLPPRSEFSLINTWRGWGRGGAGSFQYEPWRLVHSLLGDLFGGLHYWRKFTENRSSRKTLIQTFCVEVIMPVHGILLQAHRPDFGLSECVHI